MIFFLNLAIFEILAFFKNLAIFEIFPISENLAIIEFWRFLNLVFFKSWHYLFGIYEFFEILAICEKLSIFENLSFYEFCHLGGFSLMKKHNLRQREHQCLGHIILPSWWFFPS